MDLSGAFQPHIYTSNGQDLAGDCVYSTYEDVSGYSFQGQDVHQQVVDSQPAPAVDEADATLRATRREQFERLYERLETRGFTGAGAGSASGSGENDDAYDASEDTDEQGEQPVERNVRSLMNEIVEEQNNRRSSLITRETLLYWSVHLTTMAWNAISWAAYYTKKAVVGAYEGVLDTQYYFFQSSAIPYLASRVNLKAPGAAQVEWVYNKDTQVFVKQENDGRLHHLPYLTAGIWHEGLLLYTITDFVEECKYMGAEAPTPHHILSAWFLKTGVLLDPTLPFILKVITEDGEEKELALKPGGRD